MTGPSSAPGAQVCGSWVPADVWTRLASFVHGLPSQQSFRHVCRASSAAVVESRTELLSLLVRAFRLCAYPLPDGLAAKVLMVQPVPPLGSGLVLFVDEGDTGSGVEIAWLRGGRMTSAPLGLETVPASAVTNIKFAPDGRSVAMLVTLAHGAMVAQELDPLRRLRGWRSAERDPDVEFSPCEDCTVQVVDLEVGDDGGPGELAVHTFSHVFVPEYGFDMVWRGGGHGKDGQEVAFAALLHSDEGAATYLVRWKTFRDPEQANFIFMACIDGASKEMLRDKREAMLRCPSTICTSRIEIAQDAKHVFYDTMSKFGILRFNQVDDPSDAKVTRADLPNNPITPLLRATPAPRVSHGSEDCWFDKDAVLGRRTGRAELSMADARMQGTVRLKPVNNMTRISRMSPDGSLLCSIVDSRQAVCRIAEFGDARAKHVEMRSSMTGRLLYRRVIVRCPDPTSQDPAEFQLEKSGDIAHNTLGFSDDSSVLAVWDTLLTKTKCQVFKRLPLILDSRTGNVVQDFGHLSPTMRYESMQMSPNGHTVYGTRMDEDRIVMDAVDVLTGIILKTVTVTGRVHRPPKFSAHSVYLLPNQYVHTVSRGHLDVLWETSRGSAGCGWKHLRDSEASDHGES